MDIEKLIEPLRTESLYADKASLEIMDLCMDAATALSTLQAENERLRKELEYEREHANAYHEECGQWEAENEKLRAEVESLKKGYCAGCSIPAVKAEQIRDLTDAPKLRAELERVKVERDAYQVYFKDLSSKPDCNTCEKKLRLQAENRSHCPRKLSVIQWPAEGGLTMKYKVSYSGWAYVEAESEEEAEEKAMYEDDAIYEEKKCESVEKVDEFAVSLED